MAVTSSPIPIPVQFYPLVVLLLFLVVLLTLKSIFLAFGYALIAGVVLIVVTPREKLIKVDAPQNKEEQVTKKVDVESPPTFQQKREQLHNLHSKKDASKEKDAYGGKNLKKDFKKSSDQAFYEDDTKEKEHRAKVTKELLDTERGYVDKLTALVEVFEKQIKESNIITQEQLGRIFSNIDTIHKFNSILLKDLEQIMNNWSSHSVLSGVFLQMADFLKLYTTFINNYTTSMETLTSCAKSPAFIEILEKCKADPRCNGLDLPSLLIMPVQRIPRYILLLTEIHKHTPKNHPDLEKLTKSLAKVKAVADEINEARREAEALTRIYELATTIDGLDDLESLISPSRRLEMEGKLFERPSDHGTGKERYYFLFNDMLMSTKKKGKRYKFYWKNPLTSISMVPEVNNEFGLSMVSRVVILTGGPSNDEDTRKWAQAISKCQSSAKILERKR